MTGFDPKLVDEIFTSALEREGADRAAYVDDACRGNDALKKKILSLIAAAESDGDSLDERFSQIRNSLMGEVLGGSGKEAGDNEDLSGQRFGAWRLERRLARGGLATVYLACRDDGNYDQRAAFKVLRRGLDTDDLIARFRAERQILSALDHPSIASILDGGALDDGRPYLVLEFVDGVPITDYCDAKKISVRDRIKLILDVLRALHHAHRHLIVHRDIKPSNILVSKEGHVALLDFGIAKLLEPDALPGASTLTRTGVSMLTPGYCSPEQQAGETVTTASDIYQIGAVLYELLAGIRPKLASSAPGAADLPLASAAANDPAMRSMLRGDLDAIIRKAMHVDPAQRYASADEMQSDLGRYLDGRPVLAQPDTLAYRLSKMHRRRPWALPGTLAIILGTAAYVFTLLSYNEQLQIEQRRAAAAQAFLVDILASPDPFRPADKEQGSHITVVQALDIGAERIDTELADDPELQASVLASIAGVYASLDQHERAIELGSRALDIQTEVHGRASVPALESLQLLAKHHRTLGDYGRAAELYDEQLAIARQLFTDADPALGNAEVTAAEMARSLDDRQRAKTLFADGIAKLRGDRTRFAQPLISALVALAGLNQTDDSEGAMELLDEARDLALEVYGPDSLSMALVRSETASIHSAAGRYAAAEAEFNACVPIYEANLGPDHGATLATINNLGMLYRRTGQYEKAEAVYRKVLDRYIAKYGMNHRTVANSYQNLATAITGAGRYDESIPLHSKAYDLYQVVLPEQQTVNAYPMLSKAYAEVRSMRYADARASAKVALGILEERAKGTFLVGIATCLEALALEGLGDTDAASALLARSHDLLTGSAVSATYREICRVPAE